MENNTLKKQNPIRFILPLILAALLFFGWKWYDYNQHFETTDNAQVETHTSPVLARTSGYLKEVRVADFADVKAGDTIALIDDAEARIAVAQAQADLSGAEADYENARAALVTAQTDLKNAKTGIENANLNVKAVASNAEVIGIRRDKAFIDWQRDQKMFSEKSITQKQLEDSKAHYDELVKSYEAAIDQRAFSTGGVHLNEGQLARVQSQMQSLAAQLKRSEANVSLRKAQLEQANLKLSYTRIPSPISGKIGRKNMEPGQYIQPGQTLCTIVNNSSYWIVANFKETQIEKMHEGQTVKITLDAFPDQPIAGKIVSLSEATGAKFALLPPDNASGNFIKTTQRVPVKISIDDTREIEGLLRAGLSAEVEVQIR